MSRGASKDRENTIKEMQCRTGLVKGGDWLRHTGNDHIIIDEMLLTGATKEQMAGGLFLRGLETDFTEALKTVEQHLNHLTSTGEAESVHGHSLPLIQGPDKKWRFDLK